MKDSKIKIVKPTIEDLSVALDIEQKAWGKLDGESMTAQEDAFAYRLSNDMCSLALVDEVPAGIITAYSPNWLRDVDFNYIEKVKIEKWQEISGKANLPYNWHEATEDGSLLNYDPNLDTSLFLVGVGVDPKFRGNKLVDKLIQHTILTNKGKNVLGYGRLPSLIDEFPYSPSEEEVSSYLNKKRNDSLPIDYGERFHVRNGANAVCAIPSAMFGDSECYDYGFLAHYPIK